MGNRMDIGIINESNIDVALTPFLFQSFRQVILSLLNENIIA
jgi:hypothetical protein